MLYVLCCMSLLLTFIISVRACPLEYESTDETELNNTLPLLNDTDIEDRTVITDRQILWPSSSSGLVFIPYVNANLEPRVVNLLRHYIEQFSLHSCLRWVPRTHERDYVVFNRGNWGSDRCFAIIGRLGGPQHVNISERCLHFYQQRPDVHYIPHEMLHALGFVHEHQRRDRECYIEVFGGALQDYNNRIYTNFWTDITFPFDIHSVMQYRASSIFRSLFGETVGPLSEEMSMLDWMKLNYIYCRGPHICDTNYSLCANHKNILKQCIRRGALPRNLLHVQDSNWLNG
ncbi:low choriolytic enzyme-like [Homalodisca vitripennis]|uniref:low choriolytic enzyme-like n=1 Tax=Homalodisca vitripennis TaxID=197043 RepID=UPI001EEB2494|nr:low choriolytic enzyme-like [Homalodisca vitripennis]